MMLRSASFIARKDVAHMLRQKETILWIFVMPIVFFYFIGTVTGGFGGLGGAAEEPDPLALVAPAEGGFLLDELVRRLEEQNFEVVRLETSPEEDVESEEPETNETPTRRLTVPEPSGDYASFTDAVLAGEQAVLRFGVSEEGLGTEFDQVRVARAVYGVLADLVATKQSEEEPSVESFGRLREMPRAMTLDVRTAGARQEIPTGFEQTIPGILVMFTMLILLTTGSTMLVIEREQGLLRRLASTPISRGSIVLGKWVARMALALVQIVVAILSGTILFDMAWGDALPMVGLVLLGWAAFNASLGIFLGNVARTQAQMAGLGVLITMVMAALGGCWWPIEITPDWMQTLALFLPTGWAMDAMHRLVNFGYGGRSAILHLFAMAVAALVFGWLGARSFRYQ